MVRAKKGRLGQSALTQPETPFACEKSIAHQRRERGAVLFPLLIVLVIVLQHVLHVIGMEKSKGAVAAQADETAVPCLQRGEVIERIAHAPQDASGQRNGGLRRRFERCRSRGGWCIHVAGASSKRCLRQRMGLEHIAPVQRAQSKVAVPRGSLGICPQVHKEGLPV